MHRLEAALRKAHSRKRSRSLRLGARVLGGKRYRERGRQVTDHLQFYGHGERLHSTYKQWEATI